MKIWNNELHSLANGIIYNFNYSSKGKGRSKSRSEEEPKCLYFYSVAVGAKMTSPLARNPQTKTCKYKCIIFLWSVR